MKKILLLSICCFALVARGQSVEDLFRTSDTKLYWLGIDFSNVKLIGDFSQFLGSGEKSASQIKKTFFPAWNELILKERQKYDVAGMLRKDDIIYDIDMITDLNTTALLEEMEVDNTPNYTRSDIERFVSKYNTADKTGIGVVLVAEVLDKSNAQAWFHFVALNLTSKKILVHDRLSGIPAGIGLRNYWAGAIHDVLEEIADIRYKTWKANYARK
jgi:hypothetical protein